MRPTKDDLSSFFSGLSKEEVIKKNELEDEKLEKDYLDFQKAYSR
jgi:hypothetical protein